MIKRTSTYIGVISLVLLSGCGEPANDATEMNDHNAAAPASAVPEPTGAPQPEFRIPAADFQSRPALGADLFATHCARCHGAEALGSDHGPPLIHRIYEPSHHSDLAFYRAVALGVHQHHWEFGAMPPVAGISGEDTAHIIAWIRREQRAAGIE